MQRERRASQRRQGGLEAADRRREDRRRDAFGERTGTIPAKDVERVLQVRDARIEIRCPAPVKAEMEALAGRYGLTLTDYLLRLHGLAREKLERGAGSE